ncbi:MAG: diacylglycerol kinase family lipid kinase [Lachnospiraceae bacterium]|nr:diacylglycerol kinase family lipid kinase [Lachnospiraceae bacterium]
MAHRVLLIYNPRAGRGVFLQHLSEVIDMFVKAGYVVEVHPTQAQGEAVDYLSENRIVYDMIIVAGGDGTLDEAVTGILRSGLDIPIGYIPVGSTNDYAVSLGLSRDILTAVADILGGEPVTLDVGEFNDNYFIYVAAFGAFTDVAYNTDQNMKNAIGHFAYIMEATKQLTDLKHYMMRVHVNGSTKQEDYIFGMVTNSFSVGGMKNVLFDEDFVDLNDGLFEVLLVRNPRNVIEFQAALGALITKNYDSDMIDIYKTDEITFESAAEVPWTLDGEYGGNPTRLTIRNHRSGIRLLMDKKKD